MSEYIPLNEIYLKNFYDISNRTENFSKRKLNEEYANISSIVSTSSFTYDEPMTLEYSYIINNNNVECYLYYIDMIDRNFQFAVLAARDWGEIEEIKLLGKVTEINNEQEEEYETVKIIKDKKKLIPCDVFEKFFFFFQHLLADLYLIARKNIENNLFNFQEAIFEKSGKKNFIVVPAWKLNNRHEIDFNCISSFNSFKKDDLKFVSTLLDKIRECDFDLNQQKFKNYVEDNIFSSVYSNRINYYIVDYIAKPMEEKGIKYLEILLKYFNNKKTLQDLLFLFNLTREQAETITINQLLYEHEIKENVDSIYFFRNLDMKYNLKTDRSLPIMILNYINHINCFDFINPKNFLNMHNSAKKTNLELCSPNVHLLSSQHLIQYPLSLPSYNNYCAIPSIFILLERYLIANEMKMMMRIQANTMDIIQATSTPCYDINFNYEVLEVVGDSVLKYIASCFLYKKYTNENEDFLTKIRSMYIKNKFLSKIAFKNFVHFFLKTHKKNVNQWRTPFMKDYSKNSLINHTIAAKNLADTLEALLGALFIYTYEFKNVMEGLISFEIPITYLIMNSPLILCENNFSIMETAYFRINLALNEEMNYKDLRSCIENFHFPKLIKNKSFIAGNIKKKSKRCCGSAFKMIFSIFERIPDSFNYIHWRNRRILKALNHLEKNILNYSFKNKRLLITALNMEKRPADPIFEDDYQSLEFLGDALQEIFVVGNSYKLFREKKLNLVPEIMQRLKITLLSNSFMARMVVLLGLYKFMFNVGEETQTEINRFVKRVKFEKSFKNFVRHEICIPKSLSDIWESLSAAVLIDGGWKAFNSVFGTILAPYIKFFCTYYNKIETNIVSKLKNNCQEKWQKIIEFKMEYKEDERLFVHSVFLGNDLICQGKGTSNKISRERAAMKAFLTKDFALNFWIGTSVDRFDNRNLIQINHNNLKLTLLLTYVEEINFDNNYQSVFIQFEEMELPLDSIDYVTKNGKSYFLEKKEIIIKENPSFIWFYCSYIFDFTNKKISFSILNPENLDKQNKIDFVYDFKSFEQNNSTNSILLGNDYSSINNLIYFYHMVLNDKIDSLNFNTEPKIIFFNKFAFINNKTIYDENLSGLFSIIYKQNIDETFKTEYLKLEKNDMIIFPSFEISQEITISFYFKLGKIGMNQEIIFFERNSVYSKNKIFSFIYNNSNFYLKIESNEAILLTCFDYIEKGFDLLKWNHIKLSLFFFPFTNFTLYNIIINGLKCSEKEWEVINYNNDNIEFSNIDTNNYLKVNKIEDNIYFRDYTLFYGTKFIYNTSNCLIGFNSENKLICILCPKGFILDYESKLCKNECVKKEMLTIIDDFSFCEECHINCLTCSGPFFNQCKTCDLSKLLDSQQLKCKCKNEFFAENGKLCYNCTPNCEQCSSSNVFDCLKCSKNYFKKYIPSKHTYECYKDCPEGYYGNILNNVCEECIPGCSNCVSAFMFDCYKCFPNFFMFDYKCWEVCPLGTFSNEIKQCLKCNINCLTCFDSSNSCILCAKNYFKYNGICINECPNGFFKNTLENGTLICLKCNIACLECNNPENCTKCINYFSVDSNGECSRSSCILGYVLQDNKCKPCSINCKICSDPFKCIECATNYALLGTMCIPCPPNSFFNTVKKNCEKCRDGCYGCLDSYFCTKCIDGYLTLIDDLNRTICLNNTCIDTYYRFDVYCYKCPFPCKICTDAWACLSCVGIDDNNKENYYLYDNKCVSVCPSFTIANLEFKKCILPCSKNDSSCLICDNNKCLKCHNSSHFIFNEFCFEECPNGTLNNSINCVCDNSCAECQYNQTNKQIECLKCNNPKYFIVASKCVNNCNNSFAYFEPNKCETKCDNLNNYYIYKKNSIEIYCLGQCTKETSIYVDKTGLFCLLECPEGYYSSILKNNFFLMSQETNKKCAPCFKGCKACISETNNSCIKCDNNYILLEELKSCIKIELCIESNGLLINNNGNCVFCRNKCKFCYYVLYFYKGNCLNECPKNLILVKNNVCEDINISFIEIKNNAIIKNGLCSIANDIIFFIDHNLIKNDFKWTFGGIVNEFPIKLANNIYVIKKENLNFDVKYNITITIEIDNKILSSYIILQTIKREIGTINLINQIENKIKIELNGWDSNLDKNLRVIGYKFVQYEPNVDLLRLIEKNCSFVLNLFFISNAKNTIYEFILPPEIVSETLLLTVQLENWSFKLNFELKINSSLIKLNPIENISIFDLKINDNEIIKQLSYSFSLFYQTKFLKISPYYNHFIDYFSFIFDYRRINNALDCNLQGQYIIEETNNKYCFCFDNYYGNRCQFDINYKEIINYGLIFFENKMKLISWNSIEFFDLNNWILIILNLSKLNEYINDNICQYILNIIENLLYKFIFSNNFYFSEMILQILLNLINQKDAFLLQRNINRYKEIKKLILLTCELIIKRFDLYKKNALIFENEAVKIIFISKNSSNFPNNTIYNDNKDLSIKLKESFINEIKEKPIMIQIIIWKINPLIFSFQKNFIISSYFYLSFYNLYYKTYIHFDSEINIEYEVAELQKIWETNLLWIDIEKDNNELFLCENLNFKNFILENNCTFKGKGKFGYICECLYGEEFSVALNSSILSKKKQFNINEDIKMNSFKNYGLIIIVIYYLILFYVLSIIGKDKKEDPTVEIEINYKQPISNLKTGELNDSLILQKISEYKLTQPFEEDFIIKNKQFESNNEENLSKFQNLFTFSNENKISNLPETIKENKNIIDITSNLEDRNNSQEKFENFDIIQSMIKSEKKLNSMNNESINNDWHISNESVIEEKFKDIIDLRIQNNHNFYDNYIEKRESLDKSSPIYIEKKLPDFSNFTLINDNNVVYDKNEDVEEEIIDFTPKIKQEKEILQFYGNNEIMNNEKFSENSSKYKKNIKKVSVRLSFKSQKDGIKRQETGKSLFKDYKQNKISVKNIEFNSFFPLWSIIYYKYSINTRTVRVLLFFKTIENYLFFSACIINANFEKKNEIENFWISNCSIFIAWIFNYIWGAILFFSKITIRNNIKNEKQRYFFKILNSGFYFVFIIESILKNIGTIFLISYPSEKFILMFINIIFFLEGIMAYVG